MISFIDHSKQWIKSAVGFSPLALSFDRNTSLDAKFLLQEHAEVFVILHGESSADISMLARVLGFPPQFLQFYAAAAITVDQMRIGVLSVVSSTPRHFISLDERQNILDLAVAISNMLQERRIRNIQLRKQRANLLLGLNHNLGAPVSGFVAKCILMLIAHCVLS